MRMYISFKISTKQTKKNTWDYYLTCICAAKAIPFQLIDVTQAQKRSLNAHQIACIIIIKSEIK